MSFKEIKTDFKETIFPGILNSYSIIFFLNNRFLALTIMLVTFFNFYAGLSGLFAVLLTLFLGNGMHLDKNTIRSGAYSFNALLTGIGMGTFFDPGGVYFSLLTLASILTLFLSVSIGGWLSTHKLPALSIPFVLTFWFILLPSAHFENLGLTQRNIYWINEMYAMGGNSLLSFFQTIESLPVNKLVDIYLRSISSIFFQNNLLAGLLITIALLISSRILFSLSIIGFLSAYLFAQFSGSEAASITYYNIGANYMMVAFAIGGFFIIPSKKSYLWTVLLIPLTSLVLIFFYKLLGFIQLPVFSLPFSFVVIIFVYFLQFRTKANGLIITHLQSYSPETNLYTYQNNKDRLSRFLYFPIHFPFWGEWTITQGHDGDYTHIGEWSNAFDFMIVDSHAKTYKSTGLTCDDYYCYNKPILSPADGIVEEVIDNIEDNKIGTVNTVNNWGNSVIIRHALGVYSQVSHLKKGSAKIKKGDWVKRGDLLAFCGNSGRSPEPHLHFQIQMNPTLGSKTLNYPFAYYFKRNQSNNQLCQFTMPCENDKVFAVSTNAFLNNAFNILPNSTMKFNYIDEKGQSKIAQWEAYTDAYNYKYLYCKDTESVAYYVNDGFMFYFTAFYGNEKSLLYYFYLSAFKVFLGNDEENEITDTISLNMLHKNRFEIWIQDFVAPFFNFITVNFNLKTVSSDNALDTGFLLLNSSVNLKVFGKSKKVCNSTVTVNELGINEINYNSGDVKIKATAIKDQL